MVESSKILTVSYGTFSCTLEGFDDSFSTMKAIAEYFRDLAAGDRYFGAEPPVPDAEMLGRIAEREIDRRVEARTSDEGIHLRAAPLPIEQAPAMPPEQQRPDAAPVMADLADEDKPSLRVVENGADADNAEGEAEAREAEETAALELAQAEAAEAEAEAQAAAEEAEAAEEAAAKAAEEEAREIAEAEAAERAAAEAKTAAQLAAAEAAAADAAAEIAAAKASVEAAEADAAARIAEAQAAAAEARAEAEAAKAEVAARLAAVETAAAESAHDAVATEADDTIVAFDEMELDAEGNDDAFAEFAQISETPAHTDPSSVAAKLQLIQAVVGQTDVLEEDDYAEDQAEVDVTAEAVEDEAFEDDGTNDETFDDAATNDEVAEDLVEPLILTEAQTFDTNDVVEDEAELEDSAEEDDTDEQISTVLRNLERTEADGSDEADINFAEEDELSEMIDAVGEGDTNVEAEDDKTDPVQDEFAEDAALDSANEADVEDVAEEKPSLTARILRLARFGGGDVAAQDDTSEEFEDAQVDIDLEETGEFDDLTVLANIAEAAKADMATLDGADELTDFDNYDEAELSPEDEAELQADLAEAQEFDGEQAAVALDISEEDVAFEETVEADENDMIEEVGAFYDDEALDDDAAENTGDEIAAEAPTEDAQRRRGLPENDDAAMTRIMDQTDEELSDPESSRRRGAIAQLKAAVAATEAARQLGDDGDADAKKTEVFRDDLHEAVRPRRPSIAPQAESRSERPRRRPAPLTLVASQRVDEHGEASEPAGPVRPRRVSAASVTKTDASSFAEFAEEMGVTALPDLLEAAAAYTAYVEGETDFSRPQIMQKVQASTDQVFSREDGLRSFGTLLRQGRLNKSGNGRFQVTDETRFKPAQKAG